MLNLYVVLIVSVLVTIQVITALPNGAPLSACGSMTPYHIPIFFYQRNGPFFLEVSSESASVDSPITGK